MFDIPRAAAATLSVDDVRQFLYREARFLDDKEWESWLALYAPDAQFWMPSWDDDDQLDPLGHQKLDRQAGADEVEPFHLLEQLTERLPEIGDVEDQDRFLVPAELRPGQLLDQLFKRADTARKRDEGIRALEHHALALVHVGRDDALLHAHQHVLAVDQKLRDDPGHDPAVIDNRFGERSHQPDRATAIDQADAVLGQNSAELSRRVHESRVVAGAGGAVDAN